MADAPDLGSADRRANWVALRTLRQRPTVVGRTEQGDTIYEIRSVHLLLANGAAHFSQLVHCSKCGRAVPGRAVLAPSDLDRTPNPMFCSRCSARTTATPPAVVSPAAGVPEVAEPAEPAEEPPAENGRLAVLEGQLVTVMAQLRAMAAAQRGRDDVSEAVAEARAELRRLAAAQDEINQKVVELAENDAGVLARADADRRRLHASLGEELAVVRADLEARGRPSEEQEQLAVALEETSARVRELGRALAETNQYVRELAAQGGQPTTGDLEATVRRLLADARAEAVPGVDAESQRLAATRAEDLALLRAQLDAQEKRSDERTARQAALEERFGAFVDETSAHLRDVRAVQGAIEEAVRTAAGADQAAMEQLGEALSEGRGELRAEVAALARRLDEQSAVLAAELEAHRRAAGAEAQDVAQETLGVLAEPLRALTGAHQALEQRLAALTAWANATAARQDAVEQKLHDVLDELRRLVEGEQARKAALRKRAAERSGSGPLDSLEEQLRAAAERLAQH